METGKQFCGSHGGKINRRLIIGARERARNIFDRSSADSRAVSRVAAFALSWYVRRYRGSLRVDEAIN